MWSGYMWNGLYVQTQGPLLLSGKYKDSCNRGRRNLRFTTFSIECYWLLFLDARMGKE
jgi:hypothetical protein